ncbi:MAG: hypothetical protein V2B13_03500 [Pseudomonadota bacterium]
MVDPYADGPSRRPNAIEEGLFGISWLVEEVLKISLPDLRSVYHRPWGQGASLVNGHSYGEG